MTGSKRASEPKSHLCDVQQVCQGRMHDVLVLGVSCLRTMLDVRALPWLGSSEVWHATADGVTVELERAPFEFRIRGEVAEDLGRGEAGGSNGRSLKRGPRQGCRGTRPCGITSGESVMRCTTFEVP